MGNEQTKSKIITSLFWKLLERTGTQVVQFVIQILLARLLLPEEFGVIAIVMVFIHLAQVFVQSGFNTALIQKKDSDELDFSSIFYLSLFISILLYISIFFAAPIIGGFYSQRILVPVLRVLSLNLFSGALNSIQNAYISKNLMFRQLFKSSLGAIIISGIIGVMAAYLGLGVWALVIQQLVNQFSISIIMWFSVKWRPQLVFSWERVKDLFSFGSKLLASQILNVLYLEARTLIIGRIYSSSTLAYYNRGEQFPKLIVSNIDGSIQSVMLPSLSKYQDDKALIKKMMRRAISTSSFLIFPLMVGMAVVSEPLVSLVLTDKWLSAVPFLQIFCMSYALMPIHSANLQAINAMGRSDIFLKLEIIKKIMGLIVLVISIPFGVYWIATGQIIASILSSFINAYPNKVLLNYGFKEQLIDIIPSISISIVMGIVVYLLQFIDMTTGVLFIVQIIVGITIYILLSYFLKLESFQYLMTTMKDIHKSRSNKMEL